jgi:methionyl-tRNA synthetase
MARRRLQELVHVLELRRRKMSKSLGNVVDPYDAVNLVGVDGLRYFLVREVPVGLDGNFNYDGADQPLQPRRPDLGNLVHRTVSMLHQLFAGKVPDLLAVTDLDEAIERTRQATVAAVLELYPQLKYSEALQQIWQLIGEANKYIDDKKPWELKKRPERRDEISTVFNRLVEVIRTVLVLVFPVMPASCTRLWTILNLPGSLERDGLRALELSLAQDHQVLASEPVFQRIDTAALAPVAPAAEPGPAAAAAPAGKSAPSGDAAGQIEFDEFAKVQLITAVVRAAEGG